MRLEATQRGVRLHMHNPSDLGVVCTAYWDGSHQIPHHYTLGAGARLEDEMMLPKGQKLALTVYGPDSYIRKVTGTGPSTLHIDTQGTKTGDIRVLLYNAGADTLPIEIADPVYGQATRKFSLTAGQT
ncbi:phospholipase domain-containing protein, partial [Acidithiobacillus thiooxidans]|uniref:phospholipase domain-containing protein n=1 Tax=Acidithiobacillus thiooxidans TaxID=930 RepID=UPI00386F8852